MRDGIRADEYFKAEDARSQSPQGAIDGAGRAVSMIQSIYHEFGSGIVLKNSGINWQNRGCSFSLDERALNALKPRRKPFHTLNPALARLDDGRTIVYGTMGGDGQPQTQAQIVTRLNFGMGLAEAIDARRSYGPRRRRATAWAACSLRRRGCARCAWRRRGPRPPAATARAARARRG